MSRIGKKPVVVPAGVSIEVQKDNLVVVKGPKGTLSQQVAGEFTVTQEGNEVVITRPSESKPHRAQHGLYRALLQNMVDGVSKGYRVQLELVGVGYKAANNGNILDLSLGYSHGIYFQVPAELKVETKTEKGKNPTIILEGIDKQLIGYVAAKLRSLRKPEPYKGKGVKFVNEVIRRKAGKTAGKGK